MPRRRLPPLSSLRAFDAVGRHLNFTKAAQELLITQAAVSRQIKILEQHLGTPLFIRGTRKVELTTAGRDYLSQIHRAFDLIESGARKLATGTPHRVKVSLLASFAANWLVPRLSDFHQRYPAIDLRIDPNLAAVNVAAGEADLAIRYGKGGWPGVRAIKFLDEELLPACSPSFLRQHRLRKIGDLASLPILQTSMPLDWDSWCQEVGADPNLLTRRLLLQDYNIVVESALAGQGVAMLRAQLSTRFLADGKLVQALPGKVAGATAYYVILPPGPLSDAAERFLTWLTEEAPTIMPAYQSMAEN